MFKVILKAIVGLFFLLYAALFLSWYLCPQEIGGWDFMGVKYSQTLPVGMLALAGLILGGIIMAISAWSAWAAQKAVANKAVATVKKAKVKLQAQLETIQELRGKVERLEGELMSMQAGDGTWGRVNAADVQGAVTPPPQAEGTAAEVDDDDVI